MPHKYERVGTFLISEVLPFVPRKKEKGTSGVIRKYHGKKVSLGKKKLVVFAIKGTACSCCGLEGTYMALERHKKATHWHFNVYAIGPNGKEIQITLDHTIPRSKGGLSNIDNLQPMCEPCNIKKGNKVGYSNGKATTCGLNMPKNLTKLTASWRRFVPKKKCLYEDLYVKTHICPRTMLSVD
jgi:hypothetical protein